MASRYITATEFKAKCLALLNEVEERGDVLTVTKRGRPVATVQRAKNKRRRSSEGILAGKVELVGDIVNISFADDWHMLQPGVVPGEPFQEKARLPEKARPPRRRKAS